MADLPTIDPSTTNFTGDLAAAPGDQVYLFGNQQTNNAGSGATFATQYQTADLAWHDLATFTTSDPGDNNQAGPTPAPAGAINARATITNNDDTLPVTVAWAFAVAGLAP